MINIKGKSVLVTGSSSGIGFSIAKAFNDNGAMVVLNGRNKINLIKASKLLPGSKYKCADVSIPSEAKSLIDYVIKSFSKIGPLTFFPPNGLGLSKIINGILFSAHASIM